MPIAPVSMVFYLKLKEVPVSTQNVLPLCPGFPLNFWVTHGSVSAIDPQGTQSYSSSYMNLQEVPYKKNHPGTEDPDKYQRQFV